MVRNEFGTPYYHCILVIHLSFLVYPAVVLKNLIFTVCNLHSFSLVRIHVLLLYIKHSTAILS